MPWQRGRRRSTANGTKRRARTRCGGLEWGSPGSRHRTRTGTGFPSGRGVTRCSAPRRATSARLVRDARRLEGVLDRGHSVRLTHPNGTDLTLALAARPMQEQLGRVTPKNVKSRFGMMTSVPEALIYVTVDEGTAEGTFVANLPTRAAGPAKEGGSWRFENGRLKEWQYRRGKAAFQKDYQAGTAGRDQPAVLEIGLDSGLRISPGLEESGRGVLSVGVGGNKGWGGKNSSSFSDWLSLTGGDLTIDNRRVVRRGRVA